ncbi:MAG: MFS transporter [Chlamydiia bacterium]|nr:MFS transporter [Chlamydiia bacterium]
MRDNTKIEFGKWRSFLWPIHRWELKKFLPMFCMFFLIAFNYNSLRSYKDTMIVTAHEAGAEVIPFIKVWVVLPCAILFTIFFTALTNRFSREKVFYIMMSIFIAFFAIFTFVLLPAQDYLHPHEAADKLQAALPEGVKGMIAIFRNWTFSLFYVMSELWSTAILSVLWWGFANEVTSVNEAKRYYGLLMMGSNVAGVIAGYAAVCFSGSLFYSWIPYGKNSWDQSILFLNVALIISGILTIVIYRWLNRNVIHPAEKINPSTQEKQKTSLWENFKLLGKSKYLLCIAIIVLGYNLSMNLVEVIWKDQMLQLYPDSNDYNRYMGHVTIAMSVLAAFSGLFLTSNLIRRYSWARVALIPPVLILVTGFAFLFFAIFQHTMGAFLGVAPLFLAVTLGSMQNIFSRASKYTLFDATKEIAFIPLDPDMKLKGKAAIDGVGSRLGKSGGSVIHQGLLMIFGTLGGSTPCVAAIFLGVILVWMFAVFALGKKFEALVAKQNSEKVTATSS